jgi:hypothetical protein
MELLLETLAISIETFRGPSSKLPRELLLQYRVELECLYRQYRILATKLLLLQADY